MLKAYLSYLNTVLGISAISKETDENTKSVLPTVKFILYSDDILSNSNDDHCLLLLNKILNAKSILFNDTILANRQNIEAVVGRNENSQAIFIFGDKFPNLATGIKIICFPGLKAMIGNPDLKRQAWETLKRIDI